MSAQTTAHDMDIIKSCAPSSQFRRGRREKLLEFATKPQEWATEIDKPIATPSLRFRRSRSWCLASRQATTHGPLRSLDFVQLCPVVQGAQRRSRRTNEVRLRASHLERAFDVLTEVGSGLVGTTSWKAGLASDASWDEIGKRAEEKLLKGDDVKGGLTVSDAIGKLQTLTAEGKHLQDTFGLDIHDDMKPSGDLLTDAEKCQ